MENNKKPTESCDNLEGGHAAENCENIYSQALRILWQSHRRRNCFENYGKQTKPANLVTISRRTWLRYGKMFQTCKSCDYLEEDLLPEGVWKMFPKPLHRWQQSHLGGALSMENIQTFPC
ncbi:hypothetical protein NPIL_103991 [Nephila pilipes]|uniref:Uncharacterized protein n=1 Tax=Nephila pilipes TaxID=299642 RepID=A0A8X6TKE7_NEPPI|nr:hypothetical protein NPIL_103991 [Nephila pilipes]